MRLREGGVRSCLRPKTVQGGQNARGPAAGSGTQKNAQLPSQYRRRSGEDASARFLWSNSKLRTPQETGFSVGSAAPLVAGDRALRRERCSPRRRRPGLSVGSAAPLVAGDRALCRERCSPRRRRPGSPSGALLPSSQETGLSAGSDEAETDDGQGEDRDLHKKVIPSLRSSSRSIRRGGHLSTDSLLLCMLRFCLGTQSLCSRTNNMLLDLSDSNSNSLGDMDSDLLEEWRMQTTDCSTKLMGTLITQAKRRMEEQITKIEQLTKELEKMPNQQEISIQLAKMEERIKHKEDEIKSRKAHKFNRDKIDYEHGRIYTFARKYDTVRTKDMSQIGAECAVQQTSADDSSEVESSADEIPRNKLDFQGEMRLMQMITPPPGQNRRRGRGSGRRGGARRRSNQLSN
ncbi:hypothetical protein NDU88_000538 [Pleurodeles waltl]|uniref:Uncharacterized protein n=2 Tax=Pleurodeles waltl TaxID=8319 RepID=A0AAV7S5J8_PLEWA|nr:hypothetical protein NDU88_000538 [Pleurodeles waltl]